MVAVEGLVIAEVPAGGGNDGQIVSCARNDGALSPLRH